jgi:hypothetical protein
VSVGRYARGSAAPLAAQDRLTFGQIVGRANGGIYALTADGCRILLFDGEWTDITPTPEQIRRGP